MLTMTRDEQADLSGANGFCVQWAMEVLVCVGQALSASRLVPVSQAHLVGAYHSGNANLALLDRLLEHGAKVRVPTTLNASSADLTAHAPACYAGDEQDQARHVVARLARMGCQLTLTCSPYFLVQKPKRGDVIAWAESNAVLHANSILGARSLKSQQFFDLACALAGKTIETGVITDEGRKPQIVIDASQVSRDWFRDEIGYQLVGFAAGQIAQSKIPFLHGLPPTSDEIALQGMCAALGVSGSMAMVHAQGITPEAELYADGIEACEAHALSDQDLRELNQLWSPQGIQHIEAVCVGAPHCGEAQLRAFDDALRLSDAAVKVPTYLSISRALWARADITKRLERLKQRGVTIVQDTCTYYGSLLGSTHGAVCTNSLKWAAYGSVNLPCRPVLCPVDLCARAAISGRFPQRIEHG